jgi:septal ring factor EnvC (AmiA/AmiB activator)
MSFGPKRKSLLLAVVVVGAIAAAAASAAQPSLDQLNSELGQVKVREQSLAGRIASLDRVISSLGAQISLVQSREASVRAALNADQARLTAARAAFGRERALVAVLRARLDRARMILARQLVSAYERGQPDIVSVVLEAHGFTQLLDQLSFLRNAEQQQQGLIEVTRAAKRRADAAANRLLVLEATDRAITAATVVQARALAGMNALLDSRQAALSDARNAQVTALGAAQARGGQLQAAISQVEAAQAAAARAAAAAAAPVASGGGPALGPSAGWVIPSTVVQCESGGQNLPPNSAGASGYYQILPSTWRLFGGSGSAAYLASKSEQDAVASRIWNGGSGASDWVCAGIVGIR